MQQFTKLATTMHIVARPDQSVLIIYNVINLARCIKSLWSINHHADESVGNYT